MPSWEFPASRITASRILCGLKSARSPPTSAEVASCKTGRKLTIKKVKLTIVPLAGCQRVHGDAPEGEPADGNLQPGSFSVQSSSSSSEGGEMGCGRSAGDFAG